MTDWWNMLMPNGGFEFLMLLALAAVKASVLLSLVALICLIFRRLRAATRHLLWTCALCAALLFPFLSFLNLWEVPILPAGFTPEALVSKQLTDDGKVVNKPKTTTLLREESLISEESAGRAEAVRKNSASATKTQPREDVSLTSTESTTESAGRQTAPPANQSPLLPAWGKWFFAFWLTGLFLLFVRLLVGLTAGVFLVRRGGAFADEALNELFSTLCAELRLKNKPRLLRSERRAMPVVCGIFRSVVLLPAGAEDWTAERQRMVLLHELAHVARRDCLTQVVALAACAFYWFNPLVWFAARRLRVEREQACDDRVLSVGTKPSDYAFHLLEIARSMQEENDRAAFEWSPRISVAMARPSKLECRLRAVLNEGNQFGALSRAATVGLTGLLCMAIFSLALLRPTVINAQKSPRPDAAANNKTEPAEKFLTDSSVDSKQGFGFSTTGSEINPEIAGKDDSGRLENRAEQTADNAAGDKEAKPGIPPAAPTAGLSEIINENVQQQIVTPLQTPETVQLPAPQPNVFVNADYRQERSRPTQTDSEDFIDEMASVGYQNLSVDDLIRLKQANVTAEYVRNLAALGYTNLPVRELASMGIHNVTPAYIQAIRAAGYTNLSAKEMTTFRIHDITPAYINALRDVGYDGLNARQLKDFAVHEVTPAFIKAIRGAGYANLSHRDLVNLRIYEISPEFIRKARSTYGELTIRQLISLKNNGTLDTDKEKERDENKE
jgi:beta-lactamase regulating signal transducer with metallopeptidase domain